jgi:hypothetical protein
MTAEPPALLEQWWSSQRHFLSFESVGRADRLSALHKTWGNGLVARLALAFSHPRRRNAISLRLVVTCSGWPWSEETTKEHLVWRPLL